jgi:glycosyltransferase involved in cell wall biosynthesis
MAAGPASPLRVLLVANTLPPRDVSGVGEQVLQLAAGLRETGCEVVVLGRGADGVRGPKALFPLFAVPAVWRALRRWRPHVVQVHESDGGLAALLVSALAARLVPSPRLVALLQVSYVEERRAVRPLVASGRVLGRPGNVERRFRWGKALLHIALGRLTARTADLILVPSEATAAEVRRDYLGGSGRMAVLPNVTGGLPVVAGPMETGEAPGYLLFVGRLRIRKGVEVLLAALADLRAAHLEAGFPRLLIAGDGEHRAALERRAAELGLLEARAPAVRFLGRCDSGRVRGLLRGACALVVPSIYEGMPLVVLEAMEAGLPVIASRVSGIPEVVADDGTENRTGWLVPPEDPERLAAALAAAAGDPDEARRRGEAGRARVENEFRPAHAAARWRRAVAALLTDETMSS